MVDDKLTLGRCDIIAETERQTAIGIIQQAIYGTYQWIAVIIDVVLIGLVAIFWVGCVHTADRHHTDILLKGDVGRVTFVVQPV